MSDQIKHECGIALVHLKKPLDFYTQKYGSHFDNNCSIISVVGNDFKDHDLKLLKSCGVDISCLLYTSPSPRDRTRSRMPSSA